MNVIIIGGGKTGAQITRRLIDARHQVRVIECRAEIVERLLAELPKETVILGDGSSPLKASSSLGRNLIFNWLSR